MRDVGPSLQMVLDFRRKVLEDRKPLYTEFEKLEVFKNKIGDALSKIGWDAVTPNTDHSIVARSDRKVTDIVAPPDKSGDARDYFLSGETREFLGCIRDKTGEHDVVTNIDVARLRLLASGMHRNGNDEIHLGVHDANLLFLRRTELDLSDLEKRALLTSGLSYMENQSVPFWYWTGGNSDVVKRFIQYRMVIGDKSVLDAALKIGAVFGYEIPDFGMSTERGFWIKRWFSDERAYSLNSAARAYLSIWAEEGDIPALEEVREGRTGTQAAELDCIIIGVRFRSSRSEGWGELQRRNPEQISSDLERELQEAVSGVSSELLHELAKLKGSYVRLITIRELVRRRALSKQMAEELSGDNSVDVRLEAIKSLSDMAVPISEDRARTALTITASRRGLGGVFGTGSSSNDTTKFDVYQRHLLKK